MFSCYKKHGALLMLPYDGLHEDVIRTKAFEEYIRDHVDSWFALARRSMGVDRIEDLILVTGCTLVTSWGAAAFIDKGSDAEFSLKLRFPVGGGVSFDWHVLRQNVVYRDSYQGPVRSLRRFATSVR